MTTLCTYIHFMLDLLYNKGNLCYIVPKRATMEEIEAAVIKEYGGSFHKAVRGEGTEQQYMQHLLECVMPYLIPADAVQSK